MSRGASGQAAGIHPLRILLQAAVALGIGTALGMVVRDPVPGDAAVRSRLEEIRRRPPSPLQPLPALRPVEVPVVKLGRDPFSGSMDDGD